MARHLSDVYDERADVKRMTSDFHVGRHEAVRREGRWVYETDEIRHLDGIPWYAAPPPPKRHECWAQTIGILTLDEIWRCPCGGITSPSFRPIEWDERNQRNAEEDQESPVPRRSWWRIWRQV